MHISFSHFFKFHFPPSFWLLYWPTLSSESSSITFACYMSHDQSFISLIYNIYTNFEGYWLTCCTSITVGTRNTAILGSEEGKRWDNSSSNNTAINVFPQPVSRHTMIFFSFAFLRYSIWYLPNKSRVYLLRPHFSLTIFLNQDQIAAGLSFIWTLWCRWNWETMFLESMLFSRTLKHHFWKSNPSMRY